MNSEADCGNAGWWAAPPLVPPRLLTPPVIVFFFWSVRVCMRRRGATGAPVWISDCCVQLSCVPFGCISSKLNLPIHKSISVFIVLIRICGDAPLGTVNQSSYFSCFCQFVTFDCSVLFMSLSMLLSHFSLLCHGSCLSSFFLCLLYVPYVCLLQLFLPPHVFLFPCPPFSFS